MLPLKNRLTKKKDFDAVFAGGRGVKDGFLVVKVMANNLPESRFGFIISKKVSNKATARNTIKRRLRALVAELVGGLSKKLDVVFVTLPGIQKQEFEDLQKSVTTIFKKL